MRLLRYIVLVLIVTAVMLVLWAYKKEGVEIRSRPRPVEPNDVVKLYKTPPNISTKIDEWKLFLGNHIKDDLKDDENKWKLFLGNHSMDTDDLKDIQPKVFHINESKMDAHEQYLKSIDSDFRESISRSVPIHCYSGEYGLFPKKYRKFIDLLVEYSHFHKHQPTTRVLVWECLRTGTCGGIGDRIRGLTIALTLAMFSKRKLYINWQADNTIQYLEPNVINWNDQHTISKTWTKSAHLSVHSILNMAKKSFLDISNNKWQSYLTQIHGDIPYIAINTNLEFYSLFIKDSTVGQKWLKDGFIQAGFNNISNYEINSIIGFVFRYLFKVDPMIIKEVESAMRVLQINNTPFLGLHLRTGFVGTRFFERHSKLVQDTSKWTNVFEQAVRQADKDIGNNSIIFFATDSKKAKKMAVEKFGLRFRSLDMEVIHIDKTKSEKGIKTLFVEMLILSQSYVFIRGLSGFGFLSETLCSIPTERAYHGARDYCC